MKRSLPLLLLLIFLLISGCFYIDCFEQTSPGKLKVAPAAASPVDSSALQPVAVDSLG